MSNSKLLLLPFAAAALLGATGCNAILGIDGSGVPETSSISVDQFDEVDISGAFVADITVQAGPPSVEVTVDDNLVEYLDVEVKGDTLEVRFERGNYNTDVQPTAVITVPSLNALEVSGASEAEVDGVDADTFDLEVSGASRVVIDGTITTLDVDASGASEVVLSGEGNVVYIDGSGATDLDMVEFEAERAELDLSGASNADLGPLDEVRGELTGASNLSADSETDISVRTSGTSDIDWR